MEQCYKQHQPMPLGNERVIHGGSCHDPVPKDADIYIGLDYSMKDDLTVPWEGKMSYRYYIPDGHAPKDPETFRKLIEWLADQINAGKKVHVGCIGGHGRTGTLFAALVKHMLDEVDAITYVRQNYCDRTVESKAQVDFLVKHWGVAPAAPSKVVSVYTPREYIPRESPASWEDQKGVVVASYRTKQPTYEKPVWIEPTTNTARNIFTGRKFVKKDLTKA